MELLDLPAEILRRAMEMSVIVNTLDQAIMLRLVCKKFDIEIIRALGTTKALEVEVPGSRFRVRGHQLLSEYLIARTLADRACTHHLSEVIRDTIDYIFKERPQDKTRRDEYVRALCVATVQSHGVRPSPTYESDPDIYDVLNAKRPHLLKGRKPRRLECSVLENALAATAHLGISALFQKLVKEGVEDAVTYFGRPLGIAARQGDIEMARLLLEKDRSAAVDSRDEVRCNAALNGHTDVLKLLLDPKYNPSIPDESYCWRRDIVFGAAAYGGHLETIHFLVQRATFSDQLNGRDPSTGYPSEKPRPELIDMQDSILLAAVLGGQEEVARTAIQNGANPHPKRNRYSRICTPLDIAAKHGYAGIVRLLLAEGAAPRLHTCRLPALVHAVRGGWLRVAQILIDNGFSVNPTLHVDLERSPLMAAVQRGQADCLRFLLENGANLVYRRVSFYERMIGKDAYSYAASQGYSTIMRILAEYGIEANFNE